MKPGATYHGIECRGKNSYDKPISVVTLETKDGVKMYYAPPCTGISPDGQKLLTSGMKVCKIQQVGINIPFSCLQIEMKKK